jgi:hypothetical protein
MCCCCSDEIKQIIGNINLKLRAAVEIFLSTPFCIASYYTELSFFAICRVDEESTRLFFFNLHSGGWNQGPLDTAAT